METCASDMGSECLVTDLVHELSSRLEIPLLLDDNFRTVNKVENVSPLDSAFYGEQIKENLEEDTYFSFLNGCESTFSIKDEIKTDLHNFLEGSDLVRTHPANNFSGNISGSVSASANGSNSGSGSGSECSSIEIWMNKGELDTPPITPPDERISPENVFLLSPDEFRFMPIGPEGNSLDSNKQTYKSISKKVRIQPKPVSTTLNIFDSQTLDFQTVMCNVFNDVNSNNQTSQDLSFESKLFTNSNIDKKRSLLSKKDLELLQAKRKQERMIRNRESAYLSRKRKKEHVAHLEKLVQELQIENKHLKMENHNLRQRLAKYEEVEPFLDKKHKNLFTVSPRKTTALLALLLTVCLNIGSFSNFINDRKLFKSNELTINENIVPNYELRSSRSLLWANDFENLNSTYSNLNKTSCPLSVNQTESIRLESELRRWIGGDKDYSRENKHNASKISNYFSLWDRPKQHKNTSKHKPRVLKPNIQKKNLQIYQMNLLYFNTFFEAIHRRDDTFYLVSFSSDHLLLPALSHNQTSRPKMSLMLPASVSNETGSDQVEMMQIDCEVTNTQLLSVNENDIPSHMRPYSNATTSKSKTNPKEKEFEDYFVNNIQLGPSKKSHFDVEKNDLTFMTSNNRTNLNFEPDVKTNLTKSGDEVLNLQDFHTNLNKSDSKQYEMNNSQYSNRNKTSNVFFNDSYKQDSFVSSSRKNLLKFLMLNPTSNNPTAMKFSSEKSFYKSFKNTTKFLLN